MPICPRMFATTFRGDSDPADSTNRGVFSGFCTVHSHVLREGARPKVRDNMGHANIDVTQNVYGKGAGGPGFRDRKAENNESTASGVRAHKMKNHVCVLSCFAPSPALSDVVRVLKANHKFVFM